MAQGPTPDFNRVTLIWHGVNLDDTPCTGRLTLTYNGGVMLDDDPTRPISIYPKAITVPLGTTQITVDGTNKTVGFASFQVPASDDPDIQGSGGTYTLVETLDSGRGQTRVFTASQAAGTIYLNRLTSVTPVPGEVISAVSVAEFNALRDQVTLGGSGGTAVTTETVQDIVGAMTRAGANTSVTYDDPVGTVTIALTGSTTGAPIDNEAVQDIVGTMVTAAGGTYNDSAGTITLPSGGGGTTGRVTLANAPTGYALRWPYSSAAGYTTLAAFLTGIGAPGRTDFCINLYGQFDTQPDIAWLRDPQDTSEIGPVA